MRKRIRRSPISYKRRIKGQVTPAPWVSVVTTVFLDLKLEYYEIYAADPLNDNAEIG